MEPQHDLKAFLNEKLKSHGISIKKLAELSGISEKHLLALTEGDLEHLPPAPYMRGYLVTLGNILEFDGLVWWNEIRSHEAVKNPGILDALPENRFSRQPITKYVWIVTLTVVAFIYLVTHIPNLTGKPVLEIQNPKDAVTETHENPFTLRGTIKGGEEVVVNGEATTPREGGAWEKSVMLESGLNTIEIKAKKLLGGETILIRQIVFSLLPPPIESATSTEKNP